MWARMASLIPPPKPYPLGCHRPRIPDRIALDAILLLLGSGMQWGALDASALSTQQPDFILASPGALSVTAARYQASACLRK